MIQRLLNRLSLTRIILILLVSIPPQSIWAEDGNYGLTIAGIPVTSENANDILGDGDGDTGSVSYDEGENTLTLNNASITTNGNIAIEFDLSNVGQYPKPTKLNMSNKKIKSLGWTPKYSLNDMFIRMIESWQE